MMASSCNNEGKQQIIHIQNLVSYLLILIIIRYLYYFLTPFLNLTTYMFTLRCDVTIRGMLLAFLFTYYLNTLLPLRSDKNFFDHFKREENKHFYNK